MLLLRRLPAFHILIFERQRTLRVGKRCCSVATRYVGQPSPNSHPHLIGKDCVTPGISKDEYAERRANLWLKCLATSSVKNQIVLVPAATVAFAAPDVPYMFRQDSNFYYLSGLREPGSLLILYGSVNAPKSALFVAERSTSKELWDGPMAGTDGAQWLTGVDWAATHSSVANFMQDYIGTCDQRATRVWAVRSYLTKENESYQRSVEMLESAGMSVQDCSSTLHELRWRKSAAEIELMRRACAIGSQAMAYTIRFSSAGQEENVLIGKMDFECRLLGAERLSYPPVVGAGDRANTIHYLDANQLICENDLILMDAGCEFGGYVSDITRTWPSLTSFTGPQALLYDILYDCQLHLIDGLKQRRLNDLRSTYMEMLVRLGLGLQSIGILPKDFRAADMLQISGKICPHHVGHYLGLDVHDTGSIAKDRAFEPGVVITVEPGLYFKADREDVPKPFRGIGMRIEDDVLITDTGAEVLSDRCPKSRSDIEALRKP
uniref:AMP_N domain-containing protein n=1 Tax=Trichuris muris TaxID=70415 RepID=A0A5S6QM17_TRIMR